MTTTAPDGEKVAHIHLFGIRYADELDGLNLDDLLDLAGERRSYKTEIAKGRKLSKYVTIRQ